MKDPFQITEPTCISFSGGRTSAYMLWRVLQSHGGKLPADAKVIFCNTGKEHEGTLNFVNDCATNWGVDIVWLEYARNESKFFVKSFDTASRHGEPFSAMIEAKSFLPNSVMRFCTTEMKIQPISRYMKSIGFDEFDTMVGLRADEQRRLIKLRQSVVAPLAQVGVSQSDVQAFWKANDFDLSLDFRNGVTALGNCDLCFMKGGHQLLSIIQQEPSRAVWWAEQEAKIGGRFSKDRPDYKSMMQFSQDQIDMFDANEETVACFCGD